MIKLLSHRSCSKFRICMSIYRFENECVDEIETRMPTREPPELFDESIADFS